MSQYNVYHHGNGQVRIVGRFYSAEQAKAECERLNNEEREANGGRQDNGHYYTRDEEEREEITFAEFANELEHPVQFVVSTAAPAGISEPVHQDWGPIFGDLDDLEGVVDTEGTWRWNGEGKPHDNRGNSVLRIDLFESQEEWNRLLQDADLI